MADGWQLSGDRIMYVCVEQKPGHRIYFVRSSLPAFVLAGYPLVLNSIKTWVPLIVVDSVASLSFLTHFNSISRGIISLRDVLYFCSVQVVWLAATVVVINARQSR